MTKRSCRYQELCKNINCPFEHFLDASQATTTIKKYKNKVVFVGVNAAGLSSKLASFDDMLETLKPTVFFIEETKLKTGGKIKSKNT